MARFDIMPYRAELGGHVRVQSFQVGGGTTNDGEDTAWRTGNIVHVDATVGDINVHADGTGDPSDGTFYISASDSEGVISVNNGTSGAATHAFEAPVYDLNDGTEFVTANVYNASDTELDLDSGFQVGDTADLWVDDATTTVDGHNHGLNVAGDWFTITRKLDADGKNSDISGATTTKIVFKRI